MKLNLNEKLEKRYGIQEVLQEADYSRDIDKYIDKEIMQNTETRNSVHDKDLNATSGMIQLKKLPGLEKISDFYYGYINKNNTLIVYTVGRASNIKSQVLPRYQKKTLVYILKNEGFTSSRDKDINSYHFVKGKPTDTGYTVISEEDLRGLIEKNSHEKSHESYEDLHEEFKVSVPEQYRLHVGKYIDKVSRPMLKDKDKSNVFYRFTDILTGTMVYIDFHDLLDIGFLDSNDEFDKDCYLVYYVKMIINDIYSEMYKEVPIGIIEEKQLLLKSCYINNEEIDIFYGSKIYILSALDPIDRLQIAKMTKDGVRDGDSCYFIIDEGKNNLYYVAKANSHEFSHESSDKIANPISHVSGKQISKKSSKSYDDLEESLLNEKFASLGKRKPDIARFFNSYIQSAGTSAERKVYIFINVTTGEKEYFTENELKDINALDDSGKFDDSNYLVYYVAPATGEAVSFAGTIKKDELQVCTCTKIDGSCYLVHTESKSYNIQVDDFYEKCQIKRMISDNVKSHDKCYFIIEDHDSMHNPRITYVQKIEGYNPETREYSHEIAKTWHKSSREIAKRSSKNYDNLEESLLNEDFVRLSTKPKVAFYVGSYKKDSSKSIETMCSFEDIITGQRFSIEQKGISIIKGIEVDEHFYNDNYLVYCQPISDSTICSPLGFIAKDQFCIGECEKIDTSCYKITINENTYIIENSGHDYDDYTNAQAKRMDQDNISTGDKCYFIVQPGIFKYDHPELSYITKVGGSYSKSAKTSRKSSHEIAKRSSKPYDNLEEAIESTPYNIEEEEVFIAKCMAKKYDEHYKNYVYIFQDDAGNKIKFTSMHPQDSSTINQLNKDGIARLHYCCFIKLHGEIYYLSVTCNGDSYDNYKLATVYQFIDDDTIKMQTMDGKFINCSLYGRKHEEMYDLGDVGVVCVTDKVLGSRPIKNRTILKYVLGDGYIRPTEHKSSREIAKKSSKNYDDLEESLIKEDLSTSLLLCTCKNIIASTYNNIYVFRDSKNHKEFSIGESRLSKDVTKILDKEHVKINDICVVEHKYIDYTSYYTYVKKLNSDELSFNQILLAHCSNIKRKNGQIKSMQCVCLGTKIPSDVLFIDADKSKYIQPELDKMQKDNLEEHDFIVLGEKETPEGLRYKYLGKKLNNMAVEEKTKTSHLSKKEIAKKSSKNYNDLEEGKR